MDSAILTLRNGEESATKHYNRSHYEQTDAVVKTQKKIIAEVLNNITRISKSLQNLVKTYQKFKDGNKPNDRLSPHKNNKQLIETNENFRDSDESSETEFHSIEIEFISPQPTPTNQHDYENNEQKRYHKNVLMAPTLQPVFDDSYDSTSDEDMDYDEVIHDGDYKDEPGVNKVGKLDVVGEIETTKKPTSLKHAAKQKPSTVTKSKVRKRTKKVKALYTEPRARSKKIKPIISTTTAMATQYAVTEITSPKEDPSNVTEASTTVAASITPEKIKINFKPNAKSRVKNFVNTIDKTVKRHPQVEADDAEDLEVDQIKEDFGEICLKVVIRKCFQACQATHKKMCKVYRCGKFKKIFKQRSKTACISEFSISASKLRIRTKNKGVAQNKYLELTRMQYLAGVCLPRTVSRIKTARRAAQDKYERACARAATAKCESACNAATTAGCKPVNCSKKVMKILGKECNEHCRRMFHYEEEDISVEDYDDGLLEIASGENTSAKPPDKHVVVNPTDEIRNRYSSVRYDVLNAAERKLETTTKDMFPATKDPFAPLEMPYGR